jgi:hypothetical protein
MKKPKVYKSKIVQKMIDDMAKDPWYVKLRRWVRLQYWMYYCLIFNRNKK